MTATDPIGHEGRFRRLAGTLNARDLGGLPLIGGGRTRFGVLLRSDAPLRRAPDDAADVARLTLRTVVDLRQAHELVREPSALTAVAGIAIHHIELWTHVNNRAAAPADPWDITGFYLALLDHAGPALAASVAALADADGAALFHCTAGKDRTGVLALLLLDVAGVERPAVIEDYALTEARIGPIRARLIEDAVERGIERRDFARLLGATPDLIAPVFDHLDHRHGGARAYLLRHGVGSARLERLRTKLVGGPDRDPL